MKYLILVLSLTACTQNTDHVGRLRNEANQACSCHNGVLAFNFNRYSYSLTCRDGLNMTGNGDMETQYIFTDYSK